MFQQKDPEKINSDTNLLGISFKQSKKIEDYFIKSDFSWSNDCKPGPVINEILVLYVDNTRARKVVLLDEVKILLEIEKKTGVTLKSIDAVSYTHLTLPTKRIV